ncbi:MAG: hypothetical protein AAGA57_10835 [Planctomycetota bacterium]
MIIAGIILGVIALCVVLYKITKHVERKRTEAMRFVAGDLGYGFDEEAEAAAPWREAGFALFEPGHGKDASNAMAGDAGDVELVAFDYRYSTGSGDSTTHHVLAVAALRVPGATLPPFHLRAEGFGQRLIAALGGQDIDFDTQPAFSKGYRLTSKQEEATRAFFDDALLTFFATRHDPKLTVETQGDRLIVYTAQRHRRKPESYPQLIDDALAVVLEFTGRAGRAAV